MSFLILDEYPDGTAWNSCLTCKVQKQTPTTRLIDLGVSTDGIVDIDGNREIREGYAVMCETCMAEIAHMLGWQTDDVTRKLADRDALIANLTAELKEYKALKQQVTQMAASVG